jgi:hypothetical protein
LKVEKVTTPSNEFFVGRVDLLNLSDGVCILTEKVERPPLISASV